MQIVLAITGIGSENMRDVSLDNRTRMDHHHLADLLEECLRERRAVYAVVAIAGVVDLRDGTQHWGQYQFVYRRTETISKTYQQN